MTTLEIVATVLTAMVVLIAIVGGLDVLRRQRAQDRLREELLRLQTEIAEEGAGAGTGAPRESETDGRGSERGVDPDDAAASDDRTTAGGPP